MVVSLWVRFSAVLSLLLALGAGTTHAQQVAAVDAVFSLPDAPGRDTQELSPDTGSIGGSVTDLTGAGVPGAHVTLTSGGKVVRTASADETGAFRFDGLAARSYHIDVTAAGMGTYVSAEVRLQAGQRLELSPVALAVGASRADVQVTVTEEQVAEEQVREEEHQRALGVLPNFYSSYIWDAAPLTPKQKFSLAFHSVLDPFAFVGAGIVAGAEQYNNTFPGYGQGAAGYGKRFGAAYGDQFTTRMIGSAVLAVAFHQDPRYFYKGSGTVGSRVKYALESAVVCRGDDGRRQACYSYVVGAFAAGGIDNAYHAPGDRGVSLVFRNGAIAIAAHAGDQLVREFLLRRITPKIPDYEKGKPEVVAHPQP